MRRGLTRRMVIASALLTLIVSAGFAVLLLAITDLRESTQLRRETREGLVAAEALQKLVIDLETGVRGFVITREERFLDPWNDARVAFPIQANVLKRLVADDPVQLGRVRRIIQSGTSYIRDYAMPLVDAVRRNDVSARSVARTEEGKRHVDALRAEFDGFVQDARAVLNVREASADEAGRRAIVGGAIGIAGSVLLMLLFTGYLTRVIVQPIRRAALMADRLAGGDLSARMPESGVAEIGALQHSFNAMAGSLEESRDELAGLLAEQAALRRVATLVARMPSQSGVFEAVVREVGLLSGADLARMERYETDGTVTGVAGWSSDEAQLAVGTRFALEGESIAVSVRQTAGPVRVDSYVEAAGPIAQEARALGIRSSVGCPIVVGRRLWGVIAASTKREAPFPPGTESQMAQFTELVATAIANAESRAELAASRARIVVAADATRRRIERDLHDGAQQQLVSLGLRLRTAASAIPQGMGELRRELAQADLELEEALDDLREISRGIHPAVLSEGGLALALRTLARRTAVPVELDMQVEGRLPEGIEVAAYYVVSEALTNTSRHAFASIVRVALEDRDGMLQLSIRDNGVGGADPARSGLIGLKDRIEAMGGTIVVESPEREGTSVFVAIPLQGAATAGRVRAGSS